jgi:hypothetical protein
MESGTIVEEVPLNGSRSKHKPRRDRGLKQPQVKGVKARRVMRRERKAENERQRENQAFLHGLAIGIPIETLMAAT